jgi:hypothetical protein
VRKEKKTKRFEKSLLIIDLAGRKRFAK